MRESRHYTRRCLKPQGISKRSLRYKYVYEWILNKYLPPSWLEARGSRGNCSARKTFMFDLQSTMNGKKSWGFKLHWINSINQEFTRNALFDESIKSFRRWFTAQLLKWRWFLNYDNVQMQMNSLIFFSACFHFFLCDFFAVRILIGDLLFVFCHLRTITTASRNYWKIDDCSIVNHHHHHKTHP